MKISHDREYIYHNIGDVPQLTEQSINVIRNNDILYDADNDNIPLYMEAYTARYLESRTDADKIWIRGNNSSNSLSASFVYADSVFYSLQQMFFPDDCGRTFITNPWTNESISSVHCISFSNHLFHDTLESFNADLLISITGTLISDSLIGSGTYDSEQFVYTDSSYSFTVTDYLSRSNNVRKIPKWDEMGLNYAFIQAKVFYNDQATTYYRLRGALLKDYGLIVLFDNPDSWPDFETSRLTLKTDTNLGDTDYPAVWWSVLDQKIQFTYSRYSYDQKMSFTIGWDKANYSANKTLLDDSGSYKFQHLYDLNDLISINKNSWPRTYITTVYLMDSYNNVLAIGKLPSPMRKDFLNDYRFNIKVKV